MAQFHLDQLKHKHIFAVFLLLYALIIFALSGAGNHSFENLHLMQDVSIGMLSLLLALFLLAEQSNIPPNVRQYLAIGFGFAAFTELLHAFVGIEWVGEFAWIEIYSNKLRPTTWPPSTYLLPLGLIWAVWLMQRNSALRPNVYAAGMAAVTILLYFLSFNLPPYLDSGLLGIQRPTQIPLLFLMLAFIFLCWRSRNTSPLFEGMAWMGVFLFMSDFFILFSTSPHEKFTMMSHAGKLIAYVFLHVIQMRLAAENSRARIAAEASLQLEQQNLRAAMDELVFHQYAIDQHSIVGITDVQGNIIYANDSFCDISGYAREELLGKNHRLLRSDEHTTDFFRDMYRTIAAGNVWKGEICNRAKDGHLYWVMTTIVPVLDEKGKPVQYTSMRTEITGHKRAEIELLHYRDNLEKLVAEQIVDLKLAKESAEAANHAKSEFLANMSHEIRTPMNGVVGVVDILHETPLTSAQHRMVDIIRTSSLSLLGVLGDILDFSKIEAGKLEIELMPVNLRELVEGVAQVYAPGIASKNMDLIVFLPPDMPSRVRTDPGRLRQILFNLLSNAVKFTQNVANRRNQVMMRVERKTLDDGRDILNFRVIDNGIGMSEETMGKLFNSFVQADASTTRRFGGTGLGLSISKRLAELLHGRIRVSSKPDEGSEFILEIPCESVPDEQPHAASAALTGVNVLILTDHPAYAETLPAYLRAAGAQIRLVSSMQALLEALGNAAAGGFVVLLDQSRESAAQSEFELKIKQRFPAVPVVQLVSRRVSATVSGDYRIMTSPLLFDDLVNTLALAASGSAAANAGQHGQQDHHAAKTVPAIEDAAVSGRLILIAEDNEINREVIMEQLSLLGYASEAAVDGVEALEKWRSGRYSMLLTDCHMPRLDGIGLAEQIRKEEREGEHLPIIAVTGNAMNGEAQRFLSRGMDDYLSKPLRLCDLESKLAKWFPLKKIVNKQYDKSVVMTDQRAASGLSKADPAEVVWDATALSRMVGNHTEMHRRLLEKFLLGAEEQLVSIHHAAAAGDLATVAGVAHKMKSAARTVGAMRLGALCLALEVAGRDSDFAAVEALDRELEKAFREVAPQIINSYAKQET